MKEIFIRNGERITRMRDMPAALRELYDLAVTNGFDRSWFEEYEILAHELDHVVAYFIYTSDEEPYVRMGVALDDDGSPRRVFVSVPEQDCETDLKIACAPARLFQIDKRRVKEALRVIRRQIGK